MAFRDLKQRADELALEAARLQGDRNAHTARSVAILRARLATPGALALCFSAGVLAGQRSAGRDARPRPGRSREAAEGGVAHLLKRTLGSAAVRLASAFLSAPA